MPTQTPSSTATARPTPQPRAVVCPYCGTISGNTAKCERCGGRFDPLTRQATQNAMGPWRLRDESAPTRPGCSYETLRKLVETGRVTRNSVVAGPTTRQFWMLAGRVPGVAHLLGVCHSCQAEVGPEQYACTRCGAVFEVDKDRQHLGLGPTRLLPGHGSPERIAAFSKASHAAVAQPEWAWSQGVGSLDVAVGERLERSPPEREPAGAPDDAARARERRLERRLASQQRLVQTLIVICVLLGIGLLGIAFISSYQSLRQSVATPADRVMQPSRIEHLAPAPGATSAGEDPSLSPGPAAAAVEPTPEQELAPPADGWAGVHERVLTLIAQGTDEALTAGVLELEAVERRGELPEEGVELLERLRTELEARQIRSLP